MSHTSLASDFEMDDSGITGRERRLLEAARAALRFLHNDTTNPALNGSNDTIFVQRQLMIAASAYPDVAPLSDVDKRYPITDAK